jgi:thioredoxin-like negative regulator of GroEL
MNWSKLTATALLSLTGLCAQALEIKPYTPAALAQAQAAKAPVALHFHADWCPTCRAQDKTLQALKAESGLELTMLTVDYDAEKALKQEFNVRTQSTLLVFRGAQERARSVGETSALALRAALKSAF